MLVCGTNKIIKLVSPEYNKTVYLVSDLHWIPVSNGGVGSDIHMPCYFENSISLDLWMESIIENISKTKIIDVFIEGSIHTPPFPRKNGLDMMDSLFYYIRHDNEPNIRDCMRIHYCDMRHGLKDTFPFYKKFDRLMWVLIDTYCCRNFSEDLEIIKTHFDENIFQTREQFVLALSNDLLFLKELKKTPSDVHEKLITNFYEELNSMQFPISYEDMIKPFDNKNIVIEKLVHHVMELYMLARLFKKFDNLSEKQLEKNAFFLPIIALSLQENGIS